MIGQSRIGTKDLAGLCRRLAIALSAGVDVRNVWSREAGSAHGAARRHYREIREAVAHGSSIDDALQATGQYFPEFFREMARVGEEYRPTPGSVSQAGRTLRAPIADAANFALGHLLAADRIGPGARRRRRW